MTKHPAASPRSLIASRGYRRRRAIEKWTPARKSGVFRHSSSDALFVALAVVHSVVLLTAPSLPLIALGLWWNANTIAHNFIHLPFFQSRRLNTCFSAFESLVLGIPQRLWRDRHLAHHNDRPPSRLAWSRQTCFEAALVSALWSVLLAFAPGFFLMVYLPGWLFGLGLCQLQGYFEHKHGTTSHYGRLYNLLFFNDGYHFEHHARPAEHWTRLPERRPAGARASQWPAVLRWLEHFGLNNLERCVLRSRTLQDFVLSNHARAFRALLPDLASVRRVAIVGGGLYPRTALILRSLLPEARLIVIDASAEHLNAARRFIDGEVELVRQFFDATGGIEIDLLVIPLAFIGDRSAIYRQPPAPLVIVHDWLWRRHGNGVVVSWPLLKRLNLVKR